MINKHYLTCMVASIFLLLTSTGLNAGATALRIAEWHKAYGPGFEIQNKSGTIFVAVALDNDFKEFFELKGDSRKNITITGDEVVTIGVYKKSPTLNPRAFALGKFVGSQPDYTYTIDAAKKTKYLTWAPEKYSEPAKYFYPQTGKLMGLLGKSESGNSLGANLGQSNIVLK